VWVICVVRTPRGLAASSSTPVTVTVWGLFQSAGLKVSVAGVTVATVVSPLATVTVTSVLGAVLSATV